MSGILRNHRHAFDPVWHVQVAVFAALLLQFILPDAYVVGSRYVILFVSLLLLLSLSFTTPHKDVFESIGRRINVLGLIAFLGITNLYALTRVADSLLTGGQIIEGKELIITGVNIFLTNIVVFALLYWEMDGGGPGARKQATKHDMDFLFPQDSIDEPSIKHWRPTFIDYMYVSSTNATAFSPTDTMPLSRRAKMLMLAQSFISLVTIALIAGRAVNILK